MATVDVVIPVYNEAHVIAASVAEVLACCDAHPQHQWRVVIANNASTDGTLEVARRLEAAFPGRVVVLDVPVKGRGIALRVAWLTSDADVLCYMDADLSTDLAHLPALVEPLARGEADLTFGSRLHPAAHTDRSYRREVISRGYMAIVRHIARLDVTDAQCGFKAITREAARTLLPLVRDTGWFFDTELLLIAQANGFRLREVPVRWRDDPDSRVDLVRTALLDLRGVWRMRVGGVPRVAPEVRRT